MARPKLPKLLTRSHRIQIGCDPVLAADLRRIGEGWGVPASTAAYWLLRGLVADLKGEPVAMVGDGVSERAGRWLRARFPAEEPQPVDRPADVLGMAPETGPLRRG